MRVVEGIISDALGAMSGFLQNSFLPWMWDHKFWVAAVIPLIVVIAIAKWMWD